MGALVFKALPVLLSEQRLSEMRDVLQEEWPLIFPVKAEFVATAKNRTRRLLSRTASWVEKKEETPDND